jgi:hypothetical protein
MKDFMKPYTKKAKKFLGLSEIQYINTGQRFQNPLGIYELFQRAQ